MSEPRKRIGRRKLRAKEKRWKTGKAQPRPIGAPLVTGISRSQYRATEALQNDARPGHWLLRYSVVVGKLSHVV